MFLTSLVSSKVLVAVAATGLVAVGGGAAAYAGALPTALQSAAHHSIGAPAPDGSEQEPADTPEPTDSTTTDTSTDTPSPSTSATGPDATGPAAYGLCTAYTHGGLAPTSVAYQSLVTAAGSADGIAAYCLTIVKPGHPTSGPAVTHAPVPVHTGAPLTHPTGRPTTVPVGPPSVPVGPPSGHPGH